jgi:hypothetical protein
MKATTSSPPPPAQSKWLTRRGFLKTEAYRALGKAMQDRDFHTACYAMVELVCSPREVRPYVQFLVNTYCTHYLSSNLWVLRQVMAHVHDVESMARRKNFPTDPLFQKLICQLTLLVCQEKRKAMAPLPPPPPDFSVDVLACTHEPDPAYDERYACYLSVAVRRRMGALRHHAHNGDARLSALLLDALLNTTSPHHVQPAPFDFVHPLKESQRKDVAWYIWDGLLGDASSCDDQGGHALHEFVRTALMLYLHGFSKKHAPERSSLLLYSTLVVGQKHVRVQDTTTELLKAAGKSINIVFCEVLGMPPPRTEYLSYYSRSSINSGAATPSHGP